MKTKKEKIDIRKFKRRRSRAKMGILKKIQNILYYKIRAIVFRQISFFFLFCKVHDNRVVVSNFHGKGYGDNPKYIIEKMREHMQDVDRMEIVWLIDSTLCQKCEIPRFVKCVPYYSIKSMYYLATARVWIDNCRKEYAPIKKRGQLYVQTWHGGLGFKKVEAGCQEDLKREYIRIAQRDAKMTDLMLSNSGKTSEIIYKMFWYNGKILEAGLPRNDELFKNVDEKAKSVRNALRISEDVHIVLYAPTFRDEFDLASYDLKLNSFAEALEKKFGGKWIGLYRLHPNIKTDASKLTNFNNCIDVTRYADSTALLSATDVFISDFSSMVFDFALSKKPAFLYATDYATYVKTRGVWLSFDSTPFPYAFSNDELMDELKKFNKNKYETAVKQMMDNFEIRETGRASDIVAGVIVDYIYNGDLEKALKKFTNVKVEQRYISEL